MLTRNSFPFINYVLEFFKILNSHWNLIELQNLTIFFVKISFPFEK
jgi:hypothetical protein